MTVDSDFRYHPDAEQAGVVPAWVKLKKGEGVFKAGTVGGELFPDFLEGRKRPETTFNQPLASLWQGKSIILKELQDRGLATVKDVLNLPQGELTTFPRSENIKRGLFDWLSRLSLPHARVISELMGKETGHILPSAHEAEVVGAVNQALGLLSGREQKVLELRFGLVDGITRTFKEIGEHRELSASGEDALSGAHIRNIGNRSLRRLRHPAIGLREYFPLPTDSLGRTLFGAELAKDLPVWSIKLGDIAWPEEARGNLQFFRHSDSSLREALGWSVSGYNLSKTARDVIERVARKAIAEGEEAIRNPQITAGVVPIENEEEEVYYSGPEFDFEDDEIHEDDPWAGEKLYLRELIKAAQEAGAGNIEEIHRYISRIKRHIFGVGSDHWLVKAATEYLLVHPEK